jgi:DNA-binding MarR family transcriptional regulator
MDIPSEFSFTFNEYRLIHDLYVQMDYCDTVIFNEYGITTSQYAVLRWLSRDKAFRLTKLSKLVLLSKSAITRIIDYLEEKGWAKRIIDPNDRRAQGVILTEEGERVTNQIIKHHEKSLEKRFEHLTEKEHRQMISLMQKLKHSIDLYLSGS